jgi:hypothetical protein
MILDEALHRQGVFWNKKARINWHVNGDGNSIFFPRMTKTKNKTKIISYIINREEIITKP